MASDVHFLSRPLAFTDIETTGTDQRVHEIIEIGLVLADQGSLEIIGEWGTKVRPERIERASPKALEINGYRPEDWHDAVPLRQAMEAYAARTQGAVLAAWNITFEWRFLDEAFRATGVPDGMDYHRVCAFSVAWDRLRAAGLSSYSMDPVAAHLGLPEEAKPHRALNGARMALEVYRRLTVR